MRRPAPVAGITVAVVLAVAGSALAAPATTLWTKRYNGPGNGDDGATSVAASPDGTRMFVTGGSTGSTTGVDYTTIAYDTATGSRLWTRRYNGPGNGDDLARSVTVGPDGATVFVTGSSTGSTDTDYATIAYTVSTGAVLWTARYDGGFANEDFAHSLAVSPDGTRVFVTGESRGSSIYADYATIAYD
ncbi:MAG TPA: PQQ-binding-like beta-propeller repeat protein, partial [Actinomycetota bacterium]